MPKHRGPSDEDWTEFFESGDSKRLMMALDEISKQWFSGKMNDISFIDAVRDIREECEMLLAAIEPQPDNRPEG
ncbi:MAG: hypothetical protein ABIH23_18965 [bacterium]